MNITKHAEKRCQQRGIKVNLLDFIYSLGAKVDEDSEAVKIQITNKIRSEIIKLLDYSKNKILVVDKNQGTIITAYPISK